MRKIFYCALIILGISMVPGCYKQYDPKKAPCHSRDERSSPLLNMNHLLPE